MLSGYDLPYDPTDTTLGNRFTHYSDNDHAAVLWIGTLLSLIYATITLSIRCYIKRHLFGPDDWTLVAATVVSIAQYTCIFVGLNNGLGKARNLLNDSKVSGLAELSFTGQVLFVVALTLAKCSTLLLIRRLFTSGRKRDLMLCNIMLSVVSLWGLGSILGLTINCSPSGFAHTETCVHLEGRWRAITATDIITEIIIFKLLCFMLWNLRMKSNLKLRVLIAFGLRLLVIPFPVLHFHYMADTLSRDNTLSPLDVVPVLLWQQVELAYSLISATIPNLKAFIESFYTGLVNDIGYTKYTYAAGSHPIISNISYPLESLDRDGKRTMHLVQDDMRVLRPERVGHGAVVSNGRSTRSSRHLDSNSIGSQGSQDLINRRDVRWEISTNEA